MGAVGSVAGGTGLQTITGLGGDLLKYLTKDKTVADSGYIYTPSDLNLDEIDPI
jgi:hypothetical protein